MDKTRAAMQQALEALENYGIDGTKSVGGIKCTEAITALREALDHFRDATKKVAEQAEQEHVCKRCSGLGIVPIGDGYSVDPCPDCAAPVEPVKQEPVAWMQDSIELYVKDRPDNWHTIPLYAYPVRTKDLTKEEIQNAMMPIEPTGKDYFLRLARAVIAADREKNK